LLRRKMRHDAFSRGKVAENECKNSLSEIWKVLAVAECRWKVRDAVSAIVLFVPAMTGDRYKG
jgi:hypothetical protein